MTGNDPLPTPPEKLMAMLETLGIPYVLHHHEAFFTSAEGAAFKARVPHAVHVKNLFVRDKKEQMGLVVVPDHLALDLKALAPAIDLGRLSFGSPERLWTHLGVRPGSVCPFAIVNDTSRAVKMVLDESVAGAAAVTAHPMVNTMSLEISGPDLLRFLESIGVAPHILDLKAYARSEAA